MAHPTLEERWLDLLDGTISRSDASALREHLDTCDECGARYRLLVAAHERSVEAGRAVMARDVAVPTGVADRVLAEARRAAAPPTASPTEDLGIFRSILRPDTLPRRRYGMGGILGIAVYGVLGGFVLLAQQSTQLDQQDVVVTFVPPRPPPSPPPPARPPTHRARPKSEPGQPRTVLQQAIIAPTQVPLEKPPEQEPTNMAQGVEGGVEGGEVGGVPGGIVGGVVDSSSVRMEFDERMTQPEKLGGPDPQYTEKAIEREVQGTMVVRCVVTIDGRVHDCRVLKSLPFMDRAVIDALEKRRYKPATLGGKPVEVNYNFKITLKLPE